MVWGNRLSKAIAKNQELSKEDQFLKVLMVSLLDPWFSTISYFLIENVLMDWPISRKEILGLNLWSIIYDDQLYKKEIDGTFLRCINKP